MIRNYYFMFLILLGVIQLQAQSYTPIIINGEGFFKTQLLTADGLVPAEITITNFDEIDGQLYSRSFFKRDLEGDVLVGHFREDAALGQIYFRPLNSTSESLVYDISLEVGDVVELDARWCDGQNNDEATVIAVNEVNGLREVVFDRQVGEGELCEPLSFLEGVGPSATLLFSYFRDAIIENGVAQRICHASHGGIIYYPENAEVDLCGFATVSTRNLTPEPLRVFPNPLHDQLTIEGVTPGDELLIYTASGQVWQRLTAEPTLNCSQWPRGLYLLQLRSATATTRTARIVKH